MKKATTIYMRTVISVSFMYGQKISVKGDYDFIKDNAIQVEFDYSDMKVGKYDNQEEYVLIEWKK